MIRIRMHDQGLSINPSSTFSRQHNLPGNTQTSHIPECMLIKKAFIRTTFDKSRQKASAGPPLEITYFQFPKLSKQERLSHAVFTRNGGISKSPYDTLNTSYNTGDRKERVRKNLHIIKEAINAKRIVSMNQIHGKDILVLHGGHFDNSIDGSNADAIIADIRHLAFMVKLADCQGIFLFDPVKRVISNIHCGWRGNIHNILGSVVKRMKSDFGCRGSNLMAAIGPSLGPCCAEFISHEKIFPQKFRRFMVRKNYFDLWEISRCQLIEAGLNKDNIEVAGVCTRCRSDLFFSYRARKVTGRFGTVIMLK